MSSPYNSSPFDPEVVRVHRFSQARAMARDCASRPRPDGESGSIVVSMAGALKRWATFRDHGDYVGVSLMRTEIMRFYPQYILFRMAGFNTVTTRLSVNNLLPAGTVSAADRDERGISRKLFYTAPSSDEAIEVPGQELYVRYNGRVLSGEDLAKLQTRQKEKKTARATKGKAVVKEKDPVAA